MNFETLESKHMNRLAEHRLRLLICFSPADRAFKEELEKHLAQRLHNGDLEIWSPDDVAPGGQLGVEFQQALDRTDAAILLLSSDFFSMPLIRDRQMPQLLQHHQNQGLRLVPLLLRACDWEQDPVLSQLKPLPADGTILACQDRPRREQALVEIARQIASLPYRSNQSTIAGTNATKLVSPDAPYSSSWYVPRPEFESRALRLLATPGQPVVLWGPERCGKSWLLQHVLTRIYEEDGADSRITLIDLGKLITHSTGSETFYRSFAERLVDALDSDSEYLTDWPRWVAEAWQQIGAPLRKLKWLVQHHLLPRCPGRLVLALEGADALINSSWHADFYGMLRGWAEAAHTTEFARLRIVLAISTAPALLITNVRQSPFNLTQPLVLGGFNDDQLTEIARRHGLELEPREITRLRTQLGGHPYLSRLCLFAVARDGITLDEALDVQCSLSQSLFTEFLASYRERLHADPPLHAALRAVARPGPSLPDPTLIDRLERAGLITRTGSTHRLYCPLYENLI